MYFDAHTHLNDDKLYWNYLSYLKNFEKTKWFGLVNVAVDLIRASRSIQIQKNNDTKVKLFSTAWYHPSMVAMKEVNLSNLDDYITKLDIFINENRKYIIALWECWIDTHYDSWYSLDLQKIFFNKQCDLAKKYKLPLIIHSRDDFFSTVEVLSDYKDLKIYFHCWGYWENEVKHLHNNFPNIWIWYTWNISYPKAENIRSSFLATNDTSILMETDAPYLAPQVYRWQVNEPKFVKEIYEYCIELWWYEEGKYISLIEKNFNNFFSH